jgi:hypothetical protein
MAVMEQQQHGFMLQQQQQQMTMAQQQQQALSKHTPELGPCSVKVFVFVIYSI